MAPIGAHFSGFPAEAFVFLADLARNNTRPWFEAHRAAYDKSVVGPALAFIDEMGPLLREIAPSVRPEPRVGGSLFRIHRDTRFGLDRRPFKTHVGIRFRDAAAISSKCQGPVFYVEFDPAGLTLGVGVKEFDAEALKAYRSALGVVESAQAISRAVARASRCGHEIVGAQLSRVPRGCPPGADPILARKKGIFVRARTPIPGAIGQRRFLQHCRRWFEPYESLFEQLRQIATAPTR